MSTKTVTKRVALATVVALGAGVLSLVSVTSAHATALSGTYQLNKTAGGAANPGGSNNGVAGTLLQGAVSSVTGSAVALPTTGDTSTVTSVGLINTSDIASGLTAGTTQTATLLSSGALSVYDKVSGSGSTFDVITVTGGSISSSTGSYMNGASTLASAGSNYFGVVVKPNSGVTSFTVSLYAGASANNATTGGTLNGQITVTVVSASVAGTASAAKSGVYYTTGAGSTHMTLSADDTTASTASTPDAGTSAWNINQYADIRVLDAFGTAITSGTGLLQVSATNGVLVSLNGTPAAAGTSAAIPTQSTAFLATAPDDTALRVAAPSAAPVSTVVTVTYNGVVLGTKAFTFTGEVAKVTLSSATNGVIGGTASSTGTATIAFADAAGNALYPVAGSGSYPTSNLITDGAPLNAYVTGGSVAYAAQWPTSTSGGTWTFTCGTTAGSASVDVKYTNLSGTVITSNALPVTCSNTAYTYTAALDKATYAPGDIATLKVTFKDSKGNVAADTSAIASSTYVPAISGGYLTGTSGSATTAGAAADALSNGVATYKFVVGAPTIDPYNGQLIVSFGAVNANAVASTQTVAYKITTGSGATSLNDVLKGIVSLIASINKQIAALAKLVTKK